MPTEGEEIAGCGREQETVCKRLTALGVRKGLEWSLRMAKWGCRGLGMVVVGVYGMARELRPRRGIRGA